LNAIRRLAVRAEALRRVIADPAPHAARLAKRLWKRGPDALFAAKRIAKAPYPRRVRKFDELALHGAKLHALVGAAAFGPVPRIADTS
jgi:hypothetical protein